jgi:hypothetical protein
MSTKSLISQNIIAELGIEALPDDEKFELIGNIGSTIEKAVFLRMYDALDESEQDDLSDALARGDMLAVEMLIANANIDLEQIVREETKHITNQLVAAVQA